jgi:CRP-like cAMP-binding protein
MRANGDGGGLHQFKRHQHLAREGEPQRTIYRLESGWACRYRLLGESRRQITALFLPGDYCEPQWIFSAQPRYPIVALTDLRALSIPLQEIREVSASHPANVRHVLSAILTALNGQADWIVSLGRKTAIERLSGLICELFERLRASNQVLNDQCAMPLTQYDLADIVGLTPVHVNRVLQTLRARGLIELNAKWMRLPDPEGLRQLASPMR